LNVLWALACLAPVARSELIADLGFDADACAALDHAAGVRLRHAVQLAGRRNSKSAGVT
jgi:hypothetical protein